MSISYFVHDTMKEKKVKKEIIKYIAELLSDGKKEDVKSFIQELKRINEESKNV